MRSRPTSWILLTLLLAAGGWLFWQSGDRVTAGKNSALKQKIASQRKIITPNSVTVKSASTAPKLFAAAKPSTNTVAKASPFAHRLSNTTKTIGELEDDPHAILLANAFIDTRAKLNLPIPKNLQSQGDPGAYIVQADGPIDNAFRALLAAAGAQIVSYIPNDAYLVRISSGGAAGLNGKPQVQAVYSYEPYYKISSAHVNIQQKISAWSPMETNQVAKPTLFDLAVNQKPLPAGTDLKLGLFSDNAATTIQQVQKLGGKILSQDRSPFGPVVIVQPPENWTALAQLAGVQIVEPTSRRASGNDLARVTLGISADTVTTTNNYLGLSGSNVLVEVNDTGIDATHPDFSIGNNAETPNPAPISPGSGRVIGDSALSLVDTNGHGTHVAGIIAGNGWASYTVTNTPQGSVTNADFRGKAPAARLYSVGFLDANGNSLDVPDSYLQETPALTNALISNNSWDYTDDSDYDLAAASYDAAVRDALPGTTGSQPVLFVFAAGNDGSGNDDGGGGDPDTIDSPGTAKNVITVGALEQLRNITNIVTDADGNSNAVWQPETDTGFQVAGYSSRGNVGVGTEGTFGRFKPDVVAPGSFVVSTRSGQWDQAAYYNPEDDSFNEFDDQLVQTNVLNYYDIYVPENAVGVEIFIQTNVDSPTPFPTDMPIYVSRDNFPIAGSPGTYDFVKTDNQVSIPPDIGGVISGIQDIQGIGFNYAIGDSTNIPVNYDIVTEIITTNDVGNYYTVLSNLNDTLGPYYRYESGTSMATPAISGVLALMQDYFTNTLDLTPSPALLKAMLINGARASGNYSFTVTNSENFQGWGLANLPNSLPLGITNQTTKLCSSFFLDQSPTNALATGDSQTFNVTVTTNAQALPLRVTLVWTDPPGNPAAAIKLVNNLDLVVSNNVTGAVYIGNDIGNDSTFNLAWNTNNAPNLDAINNVENVFLSSASGGSFSVTVIGRSVNVNAVTAQTNNAAGIYAPNVVQDFALVISCGEGEVTNAITVTPAPFDVNGVVSNPTTDQDITFVGTTNTPLFNQFVGASSPLMGTNTISFSANSAYATNALLTVGQTNQWHFYVVTNNGENISGYVSNAPNAAFVTFDPDTLSIPREGVFADSDANSTRPEADIDIYVTTDSNLLILDPATISNCVNGVQQVGESTGSPATFNGASLGRGGTEFVADTNSAPGQVYYIGVQSEDQNASEYGFLPVFSATPFSTLNNGNQIVNGVLLPVNIPDGSPAHPGTAYVFALAIQPMDVESVIVTNQIAHQNFGDLIGTLNHNDISDVLNNHDSLGNTFDAPPIVYDDSPNPVAGSQPSDGPGSLQNFTGTSAIGPWILKEVDDSLTQTGAVTGLTLLITPHKDLLNGIRNSIASESWFYGYIDVPVGYTNLTVSATNLTASPDLSKPLELFVEQGVLPTLADTNGVFLTNGTPPGNSISVGPPLTPGRYFVGIYNPSSLSADFYVTATLSFSASAIETVDFASSGAVPILDDAVETTSITVPDTDIIQDFNVGLRVDHPRISDLVFHLISPDGTRYLLMENRGGTSTNGCGISVVTTNIVPVSSGGSSEANTNIIDTGQTSGTLNISYDMYGLPDEMIVQYQGSTIFDSGDVSGTGTANVSYGPGSSTDVSIIMNPGSTTTNDNDLWNYTVTSTQAKYYYLAFTEDTNLTTTPIKFAVPPFIPNTNTSLVITDSFETVTATDYFKGQNFGTWTVVTNQVSVLADPTNTYQGSQMLALANGVLSNTLQTVAGKTYTVSLAYRGPGIVGWWRGENNANDSIYGNNGTLNSVSFTGGEVGSAFVSGPGSEISVTDQPIFQLTNSLTIEGWIKPVGAGYFVLWRGDNRGGYDPYFLQMNGNNTINFYIDDPANNGSTVGTTLVYNQWWHIAATLDGNTGAMKIYTNGVLAAQTITALRPLGPLIAGDSPALCIAGIGFNPFDGDLDEISLYSRALSASEINAIYNRGSAGKFDATEFSTSPAQSLAEATVSLPGSTTTFFGNNTNWQTTNITFTATQSTTPLKITGVEPGMLLDAAILPDGISGSNLYYLPEQDTSALIGQSAAGTWQLEIQDDRAGAGLTNTLVSWQLEFEFANTNLATPPVFLSTPASTNINELTMLTVTNAATNFTSGTLTYSLLNPPAGAAIDPTTGVITWTPDEAQGPGEYTITTLATDSGPPSSSTTNSFIVTVNEVNTPPIFLYPTNTTVISVIDTFPFDAFCIAVDTDIPANPLTFALVSGPTGLTVSTNGEIDWTPDASQVFSTNTVSISVTDTNVYALINQSYSVTNTFTIIVLGSNSLPVLPVINTNNIIIITNAPYNAVGDGVTDDTIAIQEAIDAAAAGGVTNGAAGGTVEVPCGVYLSGPIALQSDVNLQIDGCAILRMLPFGTYPGTTGGAPFTAPNFITGTDLHDIEISGSGAIDGQGAPWWPYAGNPADTRAIMIRLDSCNRELIEDVTLSNSPMFHISIIGNAANTTVQGVTERAPDSLTGSPPSHNTDACDVNGTSILVQNCNVSVGDDDFTCGGGTSGVLITNNTYGNGHGVSIGSYTDDGGVSDITVINCTFNGTQNGIRIKSDNDRGGLVQNISYLNLGMTNVNIPIQIYSYYEEVGTPAGITPQTAASEPVAAVTGLTPIYRDITFSNITATSASGFPVGIIWARTEMPATNIVFDKINLTGDQSFDLYNVSGAQFIDSTINVSVGSSTFTLFNAQAVVTNSAPTNTLFTFDGLTADGYGNGFTFYNALASIENTNALALDSFVTLGAATFTVSNDFALSPLNTLNFVLGTNSATIAVVGDLVLGGTYNIIAGGGFASGTYTLMTYTGSLGGNLPALGATPAGYTFTIDTNTAGQVNLVVAPPALTNGVPQTNIVASNSINWYQVNVPANADFATNLLLFASLPVNVLFSSPSPPITDFELLANSTGGTNVLSAYGGSPLLLPGTTYYLGVQNTNSVAVTNAIEVDFHLVSASPGLSISSIVYTNISGTNGFLLTWFAPSNDLFQVQWTDSLTPAAWDTFTNPPYVSYNTNFPASPAIAQFNFFDDGSQSGGFGPMRFYRLILLQATNTLTLPPQADYVATVSVPFAVTNTATDSDSSLILNYVLTSSPFTSAMIDTNGIITWTPDPTNADSEFKLTTVVTDNGVPPVSTNNSFTVFVVQPLSSFPSITNVIVTSTSTTLEWWAPTNDLFQVEWTTNLMPVVVWTPFPDILTSTSGLFTFTDTNAPMVMKFYRLEWLPLP